MDEKVWHDITSLRTALWSMAHRRHQCPFCPRSAKWSEYHQEWMCFWCHRVFRWEEVRAELNRIGT